MAQTKQEHWIVWLFFSSRGVNIKACRDLLLLKCSTSEYKSAKMPQPNRAIPSRHITDPDYLKLVDASIDEVKMGELTSYGEKEAAIIRQVGCAIEIGYEGADKTEPSTRRGAGQRRFTPVPVLVLS